MTRLEKHSMTTSRPARRIATAALLASLSVGVATGAAAVTVSYAASTAPQAVASYGSSGSSYGTWVGYDRTGGSYAGEPETVYSGLSAKYRFVDGDDHKLYTEFDLDLRHRNTGKTWAGGDQSSHESTVSSTWRSFASPAQRMFSFSNSGTIDATVGVRTCLDVPWRTDPCSTTKSIQSSF